MYDVIIIGGGPAGLNAGLLLGRACRRVLIIDDGKPRNAAARSFHGYLGRDGSDPRDLIRDGRRELTQYQVEILDDCVTAAECLPVSPEQPGRTRFRVHCAGGGTFHGRKLLFATGMSDQIPELDGIRECYGASVHHCPYCDGWEHRDKSLIAYGTSADQGSGLALLLKNWSESVTVLTNGEYLSLEKQQKLTRNGITVQQQPIVRLLHRGHQLQGVELQRVGIIPADALFFNTAHTPNSDIPKLLGCDVDCRSAPRTSNKQQTNVPGIYIAGDADGDVQFVIVAAAEGATAAVAIHRELQEEERA